MSIFLKLCYNKCRHLIEKYQSNSFGKFCLKVLLKTAKETLVVALLPLAAILHALGLRRINVADPHIGHLASEPDCFLKLCHLNLLSPKKHFMTVSKRHVANSFLLDCWKSHIPIFTNPILHSIAITISKYGLMQFDVSHFVTHNSTAKYYEVVSSWGDRKPILTLPASIEQQGREALQKLGMPKNAWFVCLHVREGGYAPKTNAIHSYRNANIQNHLKAIETITSAGGWVIRMGDRSMQKLPPLPQVIDYAHSSLKSDWMDIFLTANCRLFVGDTSGLFLVSTVFGRPAALVNMVPHAAQAFGINDVYIPKLLRCKKTGKYLTFSEILSSPIAHFREAHLYEEAELELEENSPEDIDELVKECLSKLDEKWAYSKQADERQKKYKKLFQPHHYGYKSQSKMGSAFLAKYEHLI